MEGSAALAADDLAALGVHDENHNPAVRKLPLDEIGGPAAGLAPPGMPAPVPKEPARDEAMKQTKSQSPLCVSPPSRRTHDTVAQREGALRFPALKS